MTFEILTHSGHTSTWRSIFPFFVGCDLEGFFSRTLRILFSLESCCSALSFGRTKKRQIATGFTWRSFERWGILSLLDTKSNNKTPRVGVQGYYGGFTTPHLKIWSRMFPFGFVFTFTKIVRWLIYLRF